MGAPQIIDSTGKPLVSRAALPARHAPSDAAAIIHVIERAALNPDIDITKMERLIEMQERILARNAKAAYAAALSDLQQELPVIRERGGIKDRNGAVQSKYALWEDINEAIKPALAKHGFALSFRTGREDGQIVVTGILSHREGHSEQTIMHLPLDTSGSKNAVQAVGSSTSYGKRYTASALLNLTSTGEDDDGGAGGAGGFISEAQLEQLEDAAAKAQVDIPRFCRFLKVDALAAIPVKRFEEALAAIEEKKRRL